MKNEEVLSDPIPAGGQYAPAKSPALIQNRLEAIMVLINSVLYEVDAMKQFGEIAADTKMDLNNEVSRFETDLIRCALMRCGGKQRRAAALLNIKVTTLNTKIKRLGIASTGFQQKF